MKVTRANQKKQHNPIEKIKSSDPWYTDEQIVSSQGQGRRQVIAKRVSFIVRTLTEWSRGKSLPLNLLDAGCGDGVLLKNLVTLTGFKVYGIDYNPLRVDRARKNAPQAIVRQSDLRSLDFKDSFFDVIVMSQVLEHIPEDVLVLKCLARILKENGILILGVPNEGCLLAQLRNKYLERNISKTTDHVYFYTERTVIGKIAEAGFAIDKVARTGFFFPHQIIHTWLASRDWGYTLMQIMGKLIKSQVAGFHFVCRKVT